MAKLYPPYIQGTLPAFVYSSEDEQTVITIPFSMNRSVSKSSIKEMGLILKTIQKNTYIFAQPVTTSNIDFDNGVVTFSFNMKENIVNSNLLFIGQFLKAQICYIDNTGEIGFYSTTGIIKCASSPTVTIEDLRQNSINNFSSSFIGKYDCGGDTTEVVFSYNFKIYDSNLNLYYDTGDLIHDNTMSLTAISEDATDSVSYDLLNIGKIPKSEENFYIQYTITTINNLVSSSPVYTIKNNLYLQPDEDIVLNPQLDFDNGLINIQAIGNKPLQGNYALLRSDNNEEWTVVGYFSLENIEYNNIGGEYIYNMYKDFLIEQGIYYTYCLQQYNAFNVYSARFGETKPIYADFEDAFLYDGIRQLKIRFNPKVSTFKTDKLEQKVDTIGGKYPFIFRNGYTNYKEFPISGLISYQMDDSLYFLTDAEAVEGQMLINDSKRISTPGSSLYNMSNQILRINQNLTSDNMMSERYFKLKVLDWLNDGNPKVFKSPAEGNYYVRLLNVSLSPEDKLSRMIHTFNCTAYEIAEYSYATLSNATSNGGRSNYYKDDSSIKKSFGITSVVIADNYKGQDWQTIYDGDKNKTVYAVHCKDFKAGSQLQVTLSNGDVDTFVIMSPDGTYDLKYDDLTIDKVAVLPMSGNGIVTLDYNSFLKENETSIFNLTSNTIYATSTCEQFVNNNLCSNYNTDIITLNNLIDVKLYDLEDVYKIKLVKFFRINAHLRPLYDAYLGPDNRWYQDKKHLYPWSDDIANTPESQEEWKTYSGIKNLLVYTQPFAILRMHDKTNAVLGYISYSKDYGFTANENYVYTPYFWYNDSFNDADSAIDLRKQQSITLDVNELASVSFGNGVILEATYSFLVYEYTFEDSSKNVVDALKNYKNLFIEQPLDWGWGTYEDNSDLLFLPKNHIKDFNTAFDKYLQELSLQYKKSTNQGGKS